MLVPDSVYFSVKVADLLSKNYFIGRVANKIELPKL